MLALDACAVEFSRTRLYLVTACLSLVKFCSADIALQLEHGQKAFLCCTCVNLLLFMCIVYPFSVPKIKPQWCSSALGLVLVFPLILLSTIQTVALRPTVYFLLPKPVTSCDSTWQCPVDISRYPKEISHVQRALMLLMGWTFLSITLHNATSCKSDSQPRHGQPRRLELVGVARVDNITPGLRILYENVVNLYVTCRMSDSQPQLG